MLTLAVILGVVSAGAWVAGTGRRLGFLQEAAIILGGYTLYFLVRGLTEGSVARASSNALRIVEMERALAIYFERSLQEIALRSHEAVTLANWVYMWGHWPVIGAMAIWLYRSHPRQFTLTRNALLISGALGLFFFALIPVAPPRLMDLGFEDTVVRWSGSYRVLQPPSLVNQYAAFPSLHLGWNVLVMVALYQATRFPHLRVVAFLVPGCMLLAILLTGNHFILDAVGGVALCLVSLHLAKRIEARRAEPIRDLARVA
jgi:hypothetical protein